MGVGRMPSYSRVLANIVLGSRGVARTDPGEGADDETPSSEVEHERPVEGPVAPRAHLSRLLVINEICGSAMVALHQNVAKTTQELDPFALGDA